MRSLALAWIPAVLAAQSIAVRSFVVPSFADLTIKTRHTFGGQSGRITTQALYLKGPRERVEYTGQGLASGYVPQVTITQCDRRRMVYLNSETKLYWTSQFA